MGEIKQSTFKFNLEDKVVISFPNEKNISLKGLAGRITHRGYMDTVSPRDTIYPNLYAIYVPKEGLIPGMPESWLERDEPEITLPAFLLPLIDLKAVPDEGDIA